jgi:hypothetical protein
MNTRSEPSASRDVLTVPEVAEELRCSRPTFITSSTVESRARGPCPRYGWAVAAWSVGQASTRGLQPMSVERSDHRRTLTPQTHERHIMRKRYQQGSLKKSDGKWIAQWWEDGHRRKRTLGSVAKVAKAQAQSELDAILAPINARSEAPSASAKWGHFVNNIYLPFYQRKWKRSSAMTNEDRLRVHLAPVFSERSLGSFSRDELQTLLDEKAASGLSYSVVAHLRWDLRQIFRMAVAEG